MSGNPENRLVWIYAGFVGRVLETPVPLHCLLKTGR
jgi:hypothetical protein